MPLVGIEYPDVDDDKRKQEQPEERSLRPSEAERLQTELADCFLSSWSFTVAGAATGLAFSFSKKTYLPLAFGVGVGTLADIFSGCYRCQEQWEALSKFQRSGTAAKS